MPPIDVITLVEGGQRAEAIAERLIEWLGAVRLPGELGDDVGNAIRGAHARGVRVRIMFNEEEREEEPRPFEPPPPRTEPELLEQLGVPVKGIPGWRDLMHHKYVVRDGTAVWTGSANWTLDNWTRAENVLATVESRSLAATRACAPGSAPGVGRSSRTGSPSGSGPRGGGCGSPRPS